MIEIKDNGDIYNYGIASYGIAVIIIAELLKVIAMKLTVTLDSCGVNFDNEVENNRD